MIKAGFEISKMFVARSFVNIFYGLNTRTCTSLPPGLHNSAIVRAVWMNEWGIKRHVWGLARGKKKRTEQELETG